VTGGLCDSRTAKSVRCGDTKTSTSTPVRDDKPGGRCRLLPRALRPSARCPSCVLLGRPSPPLLAPHWMSAVILLASSAMRSAASAALLIACASVQSTTLNIAGVSSTESSALAPNRPLHAEVIRKKLQVAGNITLTCSEHGLLTVICG
jgi:hypothetical protein